MCNDAHIEHYAAEQSYTDYLLAEIRREYGIDRLVARYGPEVCLFNGFLEGRGIHQVEFNSDHQRWTENVIRSICPMVPITNLVNQFETPYANHEILRLCNDGYFIPGSILKLTHSAKGYLSDGTKIAPMPSIYSAQWLPIWQALEEAGVVVFTSSGNSTPGVYQGMFRSTFNRLLGRVGQLPRNIYDCGPLQKDFSWWGWFRTKLVATHEVPCGWEGNVDGIILTDNSSIPTALVAALFAIAQSCYLEETQQSQVPSNWIEIVNRGMDNLKLYKIDGQNIGRYFNCERLLEGMIDGPLKRRRS